MTATTWPFTAAAVVLFSLAGADPKAASMAPNRSNPPILRPPRDPDVAVQEEFDAARRTGTAVAYDRFIARQPNHPLAELARRERSRFQRSQ